MISICPYHPSRQAEWDGFVSQAKNGTFLFYRDYMDYHADRFTDASLLFYAAGALAAVLPANTANGQLVSPAGLTFGGLVSGRRMRAATMLRIVEALRAHLSERGFSRLLYKRVPHIYHDIPADEDLYALFRNNAALTRRDLSAAVLQADRPPYTKGRRWSIRRSSKHHVVVGQSDALEEFMRVETELMLAKFGKPPVHTAAELRRLATRFPDNIKLFTATRDGRLLAGAVIYESKNVAHTQYILSTDEGREIGALDVLIDDLINVVYARKRYFDFGTSNAEEGRVLNEGLFENKESYGARAVVHEFFEVLGS